MLKQDLYVAFSLQISFPGLVFSCFTQFSFAPFAFSARQTGHQLKINYKKKEITKQIFFITALMSETTSHKTVLFNAEVVNSN